MSCAPQKDEVLSLLDWLELALRRINSGLLHFVAVALPTWAKQCWNLLVALIKALLCDFWDAMMRFGQYAARVSYKLSRVSFFAWVWGLVAFSPLAIGVGLQMPWLIWISLVWLAIAVVGSVYGYRRWRAVEEGARYEWRDVIVKGRTIQEWGMDIVEGGSDPQIRQVAVTTLVESGTIGQMALSAMLVMDERVEVNVTAKMWVLAVLGEMGRQGGRFEMAVRNLYQVTQNDRIKQAAHSTLLRLGAPMPAQR